MPKRVFCSFVCVCRVISGSRRGSALIISRSFAGKVILVVPIIHVCDCVNNERHTSAHPASEVDWELLLTIPSVLLPSLTPIICCRDPLGIYFFFSSRVLTQLTQTDITVHGYRIVLFFFLNFFLLRIFSLRID